MKSVLVSAGLFLAALCASPTHATTRTWPGAAPCNLTLQECVDGSGVGDVVLVASATPIEQTIIIHKPFTLRAAPGYRPTLAAGFSIVGSVNAPGDWTWHVEGFTLEQGMISATVQGGGNVRVIVRDNRVESALADAAQISVYQQPEGATHLDYDISRNQLSYHWETYDGSTNTAMQVLDRGSGTSSGLIRDNRVVATGFEAHGIYVNILDRDHRVAISGNHVTGAESASIAMVLGSFDGASGGTLTALITGNVVRSRLAGDRVADGIWVDARAGTLAVDVLHNTVVDASFGIRIDATGAASATGSVRGNLLAYLATWGLQRYGVATAIEDSDNLFFDTWDIPGSPEFGPGTLFVDPRIRGIPGDPHLLPDSPAIDQVPGGGLMAALDAFDVPHTDGDGLRRFKRPSSVGKANVLDIGAFEAGDTSALVRAPTVAPGITMQLDVPQINATPGAMPQVVSNWNPDRETGIYNDHPLSMSYVPEIGRWILRQEDLQPFSPAARFNIFAPGSGIGRYLHENTPDNTAGNFTELDHPDLNNREDAIVLATRNLGGGTITDLTSPLSVSYFSGVWAVTRLDGDPMPANGGFHIYFQPPSIHAFVHSATGGNVLFNSTFIDHPSLNGRPCARVHVTQVSEFGGVSNDHHIGVYYVANRWLVFNQDGATMPVGARFHVVVDPQALDCPIDLFADGFE